MKEFEGTKGPWLVHDTYEEYNDYTPENPQIIVWDGDEQASKYICDMGEMGDFNYAEELANAKLIAAAPELLEALQLLLSHAPSIEDLGGKKTAFSNSFGEAIGKAESALNKALS